MTGTGTIVIHAEKPAIGRAGTLNVVIDGTTVGQVRQGHTADFPAPPGTHRVRLTAKDRSASNTVLADVADGRPAHIRVSGTGLGYTVLLPALVAPAVPPLIVVATVLVLGLLLRTLPGALFRARTEELPAAAPSSAEHPSGEEASGGLWWEADPMLAKRYRRTPDA